uniref:Uncharacterized protein n=1 Tax=Arion vulgaris TaxID=1028688 RepID=A0A0B7B8F7_9EUPU
MEKSNFTNQHLLCSGYPLTVEYQEMKQQTDWPRKVLQESNRLYRLPTSIRERITLDMCCERKTSWVAIVLKNINTPTCYI